MADFSKHRKTRDALHQLQTLDESQLEYSERHELPNPLFTDIAKPRDYQLHKTNSTIYYLLSIPYLQGIGRLAILPLLAIGYSREIISAPNKILTLPNFLIIQHNR